MSTDIDTQTIARIINRLKSAIGTPLDEEKLSNVLHTALHELKTQDPDRYTKTIQDIGDKLEAMAHEISRLYLAQQTPEQETEK